MNVTPRQRETTKRLIIEGKPLEAIKYVRKELGLDLKTAMRLIKALRKTIDPALLKSTTTSLGTSKLIPSIFGTIGLILLGVSIFVYSIQRDIISQGNKTEATVVANPASPVFEYEFGGRTYNYQSNTSSNPPSYYLGEQVEVYIDSNNPYDIVIDTFTDRWLLIVILGSIGSTFLGVSLLVYFFGRR